MLGEIVCSIIRECCLEIFYSFFINFVCYEAYTNLKYDISVIKIGIDTPAAPAAKPIIKTAICKQSVLLARINNQHAT